MSLLPSVAAVVKLAQNVLIGFVSFALAFVCISIDFALAALRKDG